MSVSLQIMSSHHTILPKQAEIMCLQLLFLNLESANITTLFDLQIEQQFFQVQHDVF